MTTFKLLLNSATVTLRWQLEDDPASESDSESEAGTGRTGVST
jgi:hypothetical protein